MNCAEFKETVNRWGRDRVPFLFITDFELQKLIAIKADEVDASKICFDINGESNAKLNTVQKKPYNFNAHPISFQNYKSKFDRVYRHLLYGDSYLTNLTISTPVEIDISLKEIYERSSARYKLLYRDEFLVFSPECFVKIKEGKIYSYPMKGTIDATIPNAASRILSSNKEMAEHVTIVDLIRNDLSRIAHKVNVEKFRYIEEISTNKKKLLQVSSEIIGDLEDQWQSRIGDILLSLLPAGSISGAPKNKTLEIIAEAEQVSRGYYTGVFGFFDGEQVDSGVMIRYIEKSDNQFVYRSGAGITTQSDVEEEYHETIDKVYVPIT